MRHLKFLLCVIVTMSLSPLAVYAQESATIELTGSATISIVPDRITIEIGIEEYLQSSANGDSTVVTLQDIEKRIRHILTSSGVPNSDINLSDMGNSRNKRVDSPFLMAERISAIVTDVRQLKQIAGQLSDKGVTSFRITDMDNSNMATFNRQGLKAALNAAREKADAIAADCGTKVSLIWKIIETSPEYQSFNPISNVAYKGGNGLEGIASIERRYSVRVTFLMFTNNSVPR